MALSDTLAFLFFFYRRDILSRVCDCCCDFIMLLLPFILLLNLILGAGDGVCVCRNQEDGIQESAVARKVFQLLRVQDSDRHQVVHPARAGHLLLRMLRGEVRYSMRQMHQGNLIFDYTSSKNKTFWHLIRSPFCFCVDHHDWRSDLQERPLASWVLYLHSLRQVFGRPAIHFQGRETLLRRVFRRTFRQALHRLHQAHYRFVLFQVLNFCDCIIIIIIFSFVFLLPKALAARDSSLSRTAIGTMIASNALAATWLWLARDSSPMALISSAPSAPNSAFFKWTKFFFFFSSFQIILSQQQTLEGGEGEILISFFCFTGPMTKKEKRKKGK